jgi:DNA-binding MarR family transcriptional regulator
MAEWALVGTVHDAETIRPTELAHHLAVKPPVISKMIKKLESRGWLTLGTDMHDDRKRLVSLTPHGTNMVHEIEQALRKEMHLFMSDVSPVELAGYMQTLVKLAAKLNQK